ncbi:MAG: cyclase family protein [Bacteroidales bacterium]|nr:cyclase family protein [Bacteroidales bacterium]
MNFKLIDLSHQITNSMPVYPGDEEPQIVTIRNHVTDGYQESSLIISSHTGTHIDCPRHFFKDLDNTGSLPLTAFFGRAVKIDVRNQGDLISKNMLEKYEKNLSDTGFVLFHTGYDKYWNSEDYFKDFPVLDTEAVDYLLSFNLKGIGFDAISADSIDSENYPVHQAVLGRNMVIVENLRALENLPVSRFYFSCFPLKIINGDGSPVRAVAYLDCF